MVKRARRGRLSDDHETKGAKTGRCKPQWRHQALAETLRQRIASGEFPVGTALPTERDIAAAEKVSRATVREALRFLENQGMIRRRQGSGTVVIASAPQQLRMQLNSLEALLAYPRGTEVEMLKSEALAPDDPVIHDLSLDAEGPWRNIAFRRRMRQDGAPVAHISVFLQENYAGVEADIPSGQGAVFELVEKRYGVHPAEAVVRIEAMAVRGPLAAELDVEEGTAAVRIHRRYYDAGGRLYQVSEAVYPQDRYAFETVISV